MIPLADDQGGTSDIPVDALALSHGFIITAPCSFDDLLVNGSKARRTRNVTLQTDWTPIRRIRVAQNAIYLQPLPIAICKDWLLSRPSPNDTHRQPRRYRVGIAARRTVLPKDGLITVCCDSADFNAVKALLRKLGGFSS